MKFKHLRTALLLSLAVSLGCPQTVWATETGAVSEQAGSIEVPAESDGTDISDASGATGNSESAPPEIEKQGWMSEIIGDEIKWQYYTENAAAVDGIKEIDGKLYCFQNGWLFTEGLVYVEENAYYANPEGTDPTSDNLGILAQNQWVDVEGAWKYFGENGENDHTKTGLQEINGSYYFLDDMGNKLTGVHKAEEDKFYYFDSNGVRQLVSGWIKVNATWYYFGNTGTAYIGWIKLNGIWYYLNPENAAMCTGWYDVDGKWYYSLESGAMLSNGWKNLEGKWYYLTSSGDAVTGWIKSKGLWYYMDPETRAMETGWFKADESWYYASGSGAMLSGWQKIGAAWYYFGNDGAMRYDWLQLKGVWYYLGDSEDGAMRTGWFEVGDDWYYASGSGALQFGWLKLGNTWYYLQSDGAMATGWQKINGRWYYLNEETGAMAVGWLQLDDKWYHFNSSGAMLTGLQKIGVNYYVFNSNGEMYANCQYEFAGKEYTIGENGVIQGFSLTAHTISGFPVVYQFPELPTGCEITAMTMALRYYGYSANKITMASSYLPKASYSVYTGSDGRKYGPDLDNYFVGDPFGNGTICGPGALVTAANKYLSDCGSTLRAKDITGCSFEEMYLRVSQGQPVVVMSTIGMENRRAATGWYTTGGKYVDWSTNDHGSVLIGWNSTTVTIACPIYGIQTYSRAQFEKVIASRGYRAVVLE